MEEAKWLNLMSRLEIENNFATYKKLVSSYNQKHRHYHNTKHIDSVLNHLENVKNLADNYDELELALWFHDSIYKIFSSTNELDSANWALSFLQDNQMPKEIQKNVYKLIMITIHDKFPDTNDEKLMVDIDLSILGSSSEIYKKFEIWIRKEYQLIPHFIYRKKRKEILVSFLERDRIYSHDYFFEKFENLARKNLKTAIENL